MQRVGNRGQSQTRQNITLGAKPMANSSRYNKVNTFWRVFWSRVNVVTLRSLVAILTVITRRTQYEDCQKCLHYTKLFFLKSDACAWFSPALGLFLRLSSCCIFIYAFEHNYFYRRISSNLVIRADAVYSIFSRLSAIVFLSDDWKF